MSDAEAKLRSGDIAGCLADLQAQVRKNAADPKLRVFLAQVLMLSGEWERAVTQLSTAAEMDSAAIPMAQTYRSAIQCEQLRSLVFAGERTPLVFGDPEPWIALLIQSLAVLNSGQRDDAARLRNEALELAATTGGTIDGTDFEWISDADSRLGPILEVFLNGAYFWVPFHRITRIVIEPPEDLRDLIWLPAQFTWLNGGEAQGFIPTRYAGTEKAADDALRLSRKTEWTEIGESAYAGQGQRVLATSSVEISLLDVREVVLQLAPA